MTVRQIFTKIGNIENRQIFMLLNCNCTKLANFEDFKTYLGGRFFVDTVYFEIYFNSVSGKIQQCVKGYEELLLCAPQECDHCHIGK